MQLSATKVVFTEPDLIKFKRQYTELHTVGYKTEAEWLAMFNEYKNRGTTA